jgi:CheY-like chemotaxis protein
MTEPENWSAEQQAKEQRFSFWAATCSFLLVVCLDALLAKQVLAPVLYGASLASLYWSRSRRLLWGFTLMALAATGAVWFWGRSPLELDPVTASGINRLLACAGVVVIALLVQLQMSSVDLADRRRESLRKQYAELQDLNEQISQREEEIVRQNEELQSQSEELERQSEELRISNEELASWEKRLQQLLELSRSLTAELTRSEILKRICESLGLLSDGRPAVVLERVADELQVVCHYGFGPGGPLEESLPLEDSFASLVMSVGRTAYVEDIQNRPELRLPLPPDGVAFRSVLASPLAVRGECIGTIEVFSLQPRLWEQADISTIESLAAQASISLQGAELVDEIRQERRRFEAAFGTVPFGMAVTDDADCRDVRINPAAAALFNVSLTDNVSPRTPLGERLLRHLFKDGHPLGTDGHPLLRAARGEEIVQEEIDLVLPQRPRATLLCSAAPIYDNHAEIVGAVCAFADVTVQKALQHELDTRRREAEEASVRKTRFLAAVSHDIRTPANAISIMVELIRRSVGDPTLTGELPKLADGLQRNTTALMELVGDMLDLSRFDSGKVEVIESEFSLTKLVQEEVEHLLPVAGQKALQLSFVPLDEEVWVRSDRVKLARVLGNLIGNALKFTETGEVRVALAVEPQRGVLLRVIDSGVGIDRRQLATIFDEFVQIHNPARDRSKGSGLGLSICKRLLDVMGCQIEVQSEPGHGSTFTVTLPARSLIPGGAKNNVSRETSDATREGTADPAVPLRLRILLVEDHPASREGTSLLLRQEGAEVTEAADGRTALAKLAQTCFDVVLVDMMLPDLDGREIVRAISDRDGVPQPGVFVLTGDVTDHRRADLATLKVDGVIEKPINHIHLIECLRTFSEKHRPEA